MTIHTRAATDEIYSIFNQPLKAETENVADSICGSDYEDDDYTSAGESTVTGHVSAASSDFGDDETGTFHRSVVGDVEDEDYDDNTRAESVAASEWTQFTNKDIPEVLSSPSRESTMSPAVDNGTDGSTNEVTGRRRFVPEMPDDYAPPCGPYRDPAIVAQNRLPFMTPIVEQTEYSLASMTAARNSIYYAKTPSKPMQTISQTPPGMPHIEDLLLSSPALNATPLQDENFTCFTEIISQSPTAKKTRSPGFLRQLKKAQQQQQPIIKDAQCNPTDQSIRNTILKALNPPLESYRGYHDHSDEADTHASEIQKFVKTVSKRPKSGDSFHTPILDFPGAERSYVIRRELGAGAYAPVYLAESVDSPDAYPSSDEGETKIKSNARDSHCTTSRYGFEAIKMEIGPPSAWEFYMIRTAHERLQHCTELSRAADSIVRVHELHIFKSESFLVEDYRGQGTLLDLVNVVRNSNGEGGMDEALAMFFTVELLRTVEALHTCGIIHGDIKADNCMVRFDDNSTAPVAPSLIDLDDGEDLVDAREPYYSPRGACGWRNKGLALIDFGRAIDMRAFQPSIQFIADWETKDHECNEIREMRPWTHQIDLYGIAGTIHVMLFGRYMESIPVRGSTATKRTYRIRESLKRYWDRELWNDVFDLLLNPGSERWVQMEDPACFDENMAPAVSNTGTSVLPVLKSMKYIRERMEKWLLANAEKRGLSLQIRKLEPTFAERKKKLER